MSGCRLITRHAQVLLCVAESPRITAPEIETATGISTRHVQRLIIDLERAGYISHVREARTNAYEVCVEEPLKDRRTLTSVGRFLAALRQ